MFLYAFCIQCLNPLQEYVDQNTERHFNISKIKSKICCLKILPHVLSVVDLGYIAFPRKVASDGLFFGLLRS